MQPAGFKTNWEFPDSPVDLCVLAILHPGVWIFKQSNTRWGFSYSLSLEYIVQNLGVGSKAVNQWEKLVPP